MFDRRPQDVEPEEGFTQNGIRSISCCRNSGHGAGKWSTIFRKILEFPTGILLRGVRGILFRQVTFGDELDQRPWRVSVAAAGFLR